MSREETRTFLGFEGNFLAKAARALLEWERQDLGRVVVLVPGRRAGRRLLELLVAGAGGAIEPPRIVTEAGLAQALSKHSIVLASPQMVEWAWFDALSEAGPKVWPAFAPQAGADASLSVRWSLARQLAALDRELAAEADDVGTRPLAPGARARLESLTQLSLRVREALARSGRVDPSRAIREVVSAAARHEGLRLILVGVVEISPALRSLLSSLAPRPRALIQASHDCAGGFDEFGAVRPEFWEQRAIPLRDCDWNACDDPAAAIATGLDWLARLPAGTRTDQVAIGVLGPEVLPGLAHALRRQGIALHSAAGDSLRESAPWLALEALHAWLAREDFAALANVLRHPDLERWLRRTTPSDAESDGAGLIGRTDAWHAEHLPDALDGEQALAGEPQDAAWKLRAALRQGCAALASRQERPLNQWTAAIVELLVQIYPELPAGDAPAALRTRAALEWFSDLAQDQSGHGADFFATALRAEQALRLWLDWAAEQSVPAALAPGAIEALGWLELALEGAPHLLLIGLNDGWVPQNERVNPIWGGADGGEAQNSRSRVRLARDVHALTAIALTRNPQGAGSGLCAISLRNAAGDDPLRPSRLLFHALDAVAIARAETFFRSPSGVRGPDAEQPAPPAASTAVFPMPQLPRIRSISVSGFKSFLQSPYLYYLERVLHLNRVRDDAWELDPQGYGTFVHDVLESWGQSGCRDSRDPEAIESFLHAELKMLAHKRFGPRPLPAVRLQLQQLRRRLSRFAQVQALEAQAGWELKHAEWLLEGAFLEVDGERIEVKGRIDRIDRNTKTGVWRILDYKTGEDSDKPLSAHIRRKRWVDLQLPLYRHFLGARLGGEIAMGYFAIPRTLEKCAVHIAEFKQEDLDGLLEEARRIAREMLAGRFADAGRAKPTERVQRALCGLSLLSIGDDPQDESDDGAAAEEQDE